MVIGLWWTYFDSFASTAEQRLRDHDDPVLAAADGYSYIHLLLVAGIVIFAVGAKAAIAHVNEPLSDGAQLCLFGAVALYLAGHAAFRLRMTGTIAYAKLAALAAVAVAFAATSFDSNAWIALVVLACVLAALTFQETREVTSSA